VGKFKNFVLKVMLKGFIIIVMNRDIRPGGCGHWGYVVIHIAPLFLQGVAICSEGYYMLHCGTQSFGGKFPK
jgi:hypothetical protein